MKKIDSLIVRFVFVLFTCTAASPILSEVFAQKIYYVHAINGQDLAHDGQSWKTSYKSIQKAINVASEYAAVNKNTTVEIWVSNGVYRPTESIVLQDKNPRLKSFILKAGIKLYGGFIGAETDFSQRPTTSSTILDGRIALSIGDSVKVYHTLWYNSTSTSDTVWVDGFIIQNGLADHANEASLHQWGGGIFAQGNAIISKCLIRNNIAAAQGGGVYAAKGCVLHGVRIFDNYAYLGGGAYLENGALLKNSFLYANKANDGGGFYLNRMGQAVNSVSYNNSALSKGGGAFLNERASIIYCDFVNNYAENLGGGLSIQGTDVQQAYIVNSIIWGNKAAMANAQVETFNNQSLRYCAIEGGLSSSIATVALPASNSAGVAFHKITNFVGLPKDETQRIQLNEAKWTIDEKSLCKDRGMDLQGIAYTKDMLDSLRGTTPDIGAYQSSPSPEIQSTEGIVYIKQSGTGDGSSWEKASGDLQKALTYAAKNTPKSKIWLAKGTYIPSQKLISTDIRSQCFLVPAGVQLYGGFPENANTSTHNSLTSRDLKNAKATFSGDINGNTKVDDADAYHVLILQEGSTVEGLIIQGGFATSSDSTQNNGGGVYMYKNSILANSMVQNNYAVLGGGVYAQDSAMLINCIIAHNQSKKDGGGIYAAKGLAIYSNTIVNNSASGRGGALYMPQGGAIFNSITWGNVASKDMQLFAPQAKIQYLGTQDRNEVEVSNTTCILLSKGNTEVYGPLFKTTPSVAGLKITQVQDWELSKGSAAINYGSRENLSAALNFDFNGNTRCQLGFLDLGAIESAEKGSLRFVLSKSRSIYTGIEQEPRINVRPQECDFSYTVYTSDNTLIDKPKNAGIYSVQVRAGNNADVDAWDNLQVVLYDTILPKILEITTQDTSRLYKEPNPTFTILYKGFENAEGPWVFGTDSITAYCDADTSSIPGIYPIYLKNIPAKSNYAIQRKEGFLKILKEKQNLIYSSIPDTLYVSETYPMLLRSSEGNNPLSIQSETPQELSFTEKKDSIVVKALSVGFAKIRVSQIGNTFYTAIPDTVFNFYVDKRSQRIFWTGLPHADSLCVGKSTPLLVTSSSPNPILYTFSDTSKAEILYNSGQVEIYIKDTGYFSLQLNQDEDSLYWAATPQSDAVFLDKKWQAININPIADSIYVGDSIRLEVKILPSNLPPVYSKSANAAIIETAEGTYLKALSEGNIWVNVNQGGDCQYWSATEAKLSTKSVRKNQSILWEQAFTSDFKVGDSIELTALASSQLPVSYYGNNESIGKVYKIGSKYYIKAILPGAFSVKGSQAGDNFYKAAKDTIRQIDVVENYHPRDFAALQKIVNENTASAELQNWWADKKYTTPNNLSNINVVWTAQRPKQVLHLQIKNQKEKLQKIEIDSFPSLERINFSNNNIHNDISVANAKLLKIIDLSNANLSNFVLNPNSSVESLLINNNNLSALDLSSQTRIQNLNCKNNALTFNSLRLPSSKGDFLYDVQKMMVFGFETYDSVLNKNVYILFEEQELDLSAQKLVNGISTQYIWYSGDTLYNMPLVNPDNVGIYKMPKEAGTYRCEMTNTEFPTWTLKTVEVTLENKISPDANNRIYVDIEGKADADGSSWTNASPNLQAALYAASLLTPPASVWVKKGVYTPLAKYSMPNNEVGQMKELTFRIADGVCLYGGFKGTENLLSDRILDIQDATSLSTLSGDYKQDDSWKYDPVYGQWYAENLSENSYHILVFEKDQNSTMTKSVVDGFNIQGADAGASIPSSKSLHNMGGAVLMLGGDSNSIENCRIEKNMAHFYGAGALLINGGSIKNTYFNKNIAQSGAAIYIHQSGSVENAVIDSNQGDQGTGIYFAGGGYANAVHLKNNRAQTVGAGLYFDAGGLGTNLLIEKNRSFESGAGVYFAKGGTLVNATIVENISLYFAAGVDMNEGGQLYNSIVWDNVNTTKSDDSLSLRVQGNNSQIIRNGLQQEMKSNFFLDPHFTDATNSDYTLTSESPCINAGDSNLLYPYMIHDFDGAERVQSSYPDLGYKETSHTLKVQFVVSDTVQDYNGKSTEIQVQTLPFSLPIKVEYDPNNPVEIGEYAVTISMLDPAFEGTRKTTLNIQKGKQILSKNLLPQTLLAFDTLWLEDRLSSGLALTYHLSDSSIASISTFDEKPYLLPLKMGELQLRVSQEGDNHYHPFDSLYPEIIHIAKVKANIYITNTSVYYDGTTKKIDYVIEPAHLKSKCSYTYQSDFSIRDTAVEIGAYLANISIEDSSYEGKKQSVFNIIPKKMAKISIEDTVQYVNNLKHTIRVATTPKNLPYTVQYFNAQNQALDSVVSVGFYTALIQIQDSVFQGTMSASLHIYKQNASISLGDTITYFNGQKQDIKVYTQPEGLAYTLTYKKAQENINEISEIGTYQVQVQIQDTFYIGEAFAQFSILAKKQASMSVSNQKQYYNDSARKLSVSTIPADLHTTQKFYLNESLVDSAVLPGIYKVEVGIVDSVYEGKSIQELEILIEEAEIFISERMWIFNDTAHQVKVETTPLGLNVELRYYKDEVEVEAPKEVGEYRVDAKIVEDYYKGAVSTICYIRRAGSKIEITQTEHYYNGKPQQASIKVTPDMPHTTTYWLDVVSFPTVSEVGTYIVSVKVQEPDHLGAAWAYFNILPKIEAKIDFSEHIQYYDGTPKNIGVTTEPIGLDYTLKYLSGTDTLLSIIEPGDYQALVQVTDSIYTAFGTANFIIRKKDAKIILHDTTFCYDGTAKIVEPILYPSDLPVVVTYNGSAVPPKKVGVYKVLVRSSDSLYSNMVDSAIMVILPLPLLRIDAAIQPNHQEVVFTNIGDQWEAYRYFWNFGDNSEIQVQDESTERHLYEKFDLYTVSLTAQHIDYGCTINTSTEIKLESLSLVSLYPSLVKDKFTLYSLEGLYAYRIYRLGNSALVMTSDFLSPVIEHSVDVTHLPPASYIMRIKVGNAWVTKKFVRLAN